MGAFRGKLSRDIKNSGDERIIFGGDKTIIKNPIKEVGSTTHYPRSATSPKEMGAVVETKEPPFKKWYLTTLIWEGSCIPRVHSLRGPIRGT